MSPALSFIWFLIALIIVRMAASFVCFAAGAPFIMSTETASGEMLRMAGIRPGMKVYDLGCGDSQLLLLAAEKGAEAFGVELDPFMVAYSWLRILRSPYKDRVHVRWGNLWWASVKDADVVFVYLMPWYMSKYKRLLERQLKPGALVVSNSFAFEDMAPCATGDGAAVYAYRFNPRRSTGSAGPAGDGGP